MHGPIFVAILMDAFLNPLTLSQNNQHVEKAAFLVWFRQDQLIQTAILVFVEPTLAATAKAAWDILHIAYANKSQTRIFTWHDQLIRVTKDARSIADYLHQVRSLCAELATAGAPASNPELS